MMISDKHNQHVHGSYAKDTAPSSNVNVTDKDESKEIIMHENLLRSCPAYSSDFNGVIYLLSSSLFIVPSLQTFDLIRLSASLS